MKFSTAETATQTQWEFSNTLAQHVYQAVSCTDDKAKAFMEVYNN